MKDQIDLKTIKEQAKSVKKNYPDLFNYLIRRDQATAELTRSIMDSIPSPDDIPTPKIPFIDLVITLATPQDECSICDDDGSLWLTPKLRAKLCKVCRNGIYLRGTGIDFLADE